MVAVLTDATGNETVIGSGVGAGVGVGGGVGVGDAVGDGEGDGLAVGVGVGPATQPANLNLPMRVFQAVPVVLRYSVVNQKEQSSTGSTVMAL